MNITRWKFKAIHPDWHTTIAEINKAVMGAFNTAQRKGRIMCHVFPCQRLCCPIKCGCAPRRRKKLNFDTSIVWEISGWFRALRTTLGDIDLSHINRYNYFYSRLIKCRDQLETARSLCAAHRKSETYQYIIRAQRTIDLAVILYEKGNVEQEWTKEKTLVVLKKQRRAYQEVKHLR
jgi:hypothetical protein